MKGSFSLCGLFITANAIDAIGVARYYVVLGFSGTKSGDELLFDAGD